MKGKPLIVILTTGPSDSSYAWLRVPAAWPPFISENSSLSSCRCFVLIRLEREEHEPCFERVCFCFVWKVCWSS